MKISLEVTCPSCPLQIDGVWDGLGIRYRARDRQWQLWISPDSSAIDMDDWLNSNLDTPSATGGIGTHLEDDIPLAMSLIAEKVGGWLSRQPTHFVISRELAANTVRHLREVAEDTSGDLYRNSLLELAEQLTQNPVARP